MLPKIAVGRFESQEKWLENLSLTAGEVIAIDGDGVSIDEIRTWIVDAINSVETRPKYVVVVWNADKLSDACQSVLLKPLEEVAMNTVIVLVVENENRLLPTILSRSQVEYFRDTSDKNAELWSQVVRCWSSGPAACISLSDTLDRQSAAELLEEIIGRLSAGLGIEVNRSRVEVLNLAITTLSDLRETNVNQKLLVDNFLIASWKMAKTR